MYWRLFWHTAFVRLTAIIFRHHHHHLHKQFHKEAANWHESWTWSWLYALTRALVQRAEVGDLSKHPTRLWNMKTAKSYDTRRNHSLTFSQAKRTGAVARPSLRSAAAGLPIVSDDDTKSKRSSTNWKARPRFLPYWKAVSTSGASAPDIVAACGDKSSSVSRGVSTNLSTYSL